MQYSKDVENMICIAKGVSGRFEHGPAPIPEEGAWVQAKEIKDVKGFKTATGAISSLKAPVRLPTNMLNMLMSWHAWLKPVSPALSTHRPLMLRWR